MAIDKEIESAVKKVTTELAQPTAVSKRLLAWLEDESNRELSHSDSIEHLQNLRDAIELKEG